MSNGASSARAERVEADVLPLLVPAFRTPDPTIEIVTSDIARFWRVFDSAPDDELEARIKSDYLKPGSPGLAYFSLTKFNGMSGLAFAIRLHRADYARVRAQTLEVGKAEPQIRRMLGKFLRLVPEAKIPTVTFVIGRFSSGGTSFGGGIVLGAEMEVNALPQIPAIVAHETVHFNQAVRANGLLGKTIAEGMADLVGEMVSGRQINQRAHTYGRAHEAALWREWRAETQGKNRTLDWIGTFSQTEPRPGDLGYFLGYRICEAYLKRMDLSVAELLQETDAEKIVRESGYNPK